MRFRFAADRALGALAKWLRILGYDTVFESDVSSQSFFENLEDDRILLTRTRKIQKQFSSYRTVFITSDHPADQLKQVVDEIGISQADIRPFSRCITCNLPIAAVGKEEVYGRVPDYIWQTHDTFNKCSRCGRIYWPGSHAERSMERINQLFK
jgi:uncharacterized protein with PIN domain